MKFYSYIGIFKSGLSYTNGMIDNIAVFSVYKNNPHKRVVENYPIKCCITEEADELLDVLKEIKI